MSLFLKRLFFYLGLLIFLLFIGINVVAYFYGPVVISKFSKNTVTIEKFQYPLFPFYISVKGLQFSNKNLLISIRKTTLSLNSLSSVFRREGFLNVAIDGASMDLYESEDKSESDLNILEYILLFNSVNIYNSRVHYKGTSEIIVPIEIASISLDKGNFYFLLDDVLFKKGDISENLKVVLKGGINREGIYLYEGGIKGGYINLNIELLENQKDEKVIKGYFNSEILKLFDVEAHGGLYINGHYKDKKLLLDYEANIDVSDNNIISKGSLVSKKGKININNNLTFNGNNINTNCEYNYRRGLVLGDITLQDYEVLREKPFHYKIDLNKKNFKIGNSVILGEKYSFEGEGSFNNKEIVIKQLGIQSESTSINLNGLISYEGIKGEIEGFVNNNRDIIELLKIENHNISINGAFAFTKWSKNGQISINFDRSLLDNVDSINVTIKGRETYKGLMTIAMKHGQIKVKGEFLDLNKWKLDYALQRVEIKGWNENKLEESLRINGFGIINSDNNVNVKGVINITGLIDQPIYLTHSYVDGRLNLVVKDMLTLQVGKYNGVNDYNYIVTMDGDKKKIPIRATGYIGMKNKIFSYLFDSLYIGHLPFNVSGHLDLNKYILNTTIENKSVNYPIKAIFTSDLIFKEGLFSTKGQIDAREQYKINCRLKKSHNKLYLDVFNLQSHSTNIRAYGDIKDKSFDINISGFINNNRDVLSKINLNHSINLKGNVEMSNNIVRYQTDISFKEDIFTLNNIKSTGDYNIKNKNIKTNTILESNYGKINLKANKKLSNPLYFNIHADKLNSEIIEKIGKIKLEEQGFISTSINGEYNDVIKFNGNLEVEKLFLNKGKLLFTFQDDLLTVDSLSLDDEILHKPFSYSFKDKYLKVFVDMDLLQNKYVRARDVYIDLKGPIDSLDIKSHFYIDNTALGTINVQAEGNLDDLRLYVKSDNLTVDTKYYKNGKKGYMNVFFLYGDIIKGEIPFAIEKDVNSEIRVTSNKSSITLNQKNKIDIEDLNFLVKKDGITNLNCFLSNDFFSNVVFSDVAIGLKGITGLVNLNKSILKYNDIFNLHTEGEISISYNYSDMPRLKGTVLGEGLLNYKDVGIKLPIKQFKLEAQNYHIKLNALLYELESWLELDYSTENYMNYLDSILKIRGEHIYVNKMGFSGIFDVNVEYDKNKKELGGDLSIVKSQYTFDSSLTVASSSNEKNDMELPISLNLNVKTDQPVIVESGFANASVNVNLKVLYQRELKLIGKITTTDTEVVIGREKFVIYENYIRFRGKIAPYLYLEARGTGEYSYVILKIYGDLPNYKIDIINIDPNSSTFYETETGYNPQNLLTDVFAGLLFNDILKVTENIIGINKIGFEQRAEGGENVNYLKIGRQFSDRFEVKYIIGSQEEESEVMMVGEYILLDWFKFSLYSQNRGGSGVGFTFFNNF